MHVYKRGKRLVFGHFGGFFGMEIRGIDPVLNGTVNSLRAHSRDDQSRLRFFHLTYCNVPLTRRITYGSLGCFCFAANIRKIVSAVCGPYSNANLSRNSTKYPMSRLMVAGSTESSHASLRPKPSVWKLHHSDHEKLTFAPRGARRDTGGALPPAG